MPHWWQQMATSTLALLKWSPEEQGWARAEPRYPTASRPTCRASVDGARRGRRWRRDLSRERCEEPSLTPGRQGWRKRGAGGVTATHLRLTRAKGQCCALSELFPRGQRQSADRNSAGHLRPPPVPPGPTRSELKDQGRRLPHASWLCPTSDRCHCPLGKTLGPGAASRRHLQVH